MLSLTQRWPWLTLFPVLLKAFLVRDALVITGGCLAPFIIIGKIYEEQDTSSLSVPRLIIYDAMRQGNDWSLYHRSVILVSILWLTSSQVVLVSRYVLPIGTTPHYFMMQWGRATIGHCIIVVWYWSIYYDWPIHRSSLFFGVLWYQHNIISLSPFPHELLPSSTSNCCHLVVGMGEKSSPWRFLGERNPPLW